MNECLLHHCGPQFLFFGSPRPSLWPRVKTRRYGEVTSRSSCSEVLRGLPTNTRTLVPCIAGNGNNEARAESFKGIPLHTSVSPPSPRSMDGAYMREEVREREEEEKSVEETMGPTHRPHQANEPGLLTASFFFCLLLPFKLALEELVEQEVGREKLK